MEVMHLSGTIAIGLIILLHPVIAFAHGEEIGESELSEKDVIPTSNLPKITKEEKETMYETDALMEDEEGHYEDEEYHDELSMFDSWTSKTTSGIVRYSLTPSPMSDAGAKLGGFLIDILEVTGHMEVHLVTRGLIVQGLDTVCSMLMSRRIKIELYPNLLKFLTHLGPIEGYLSENQFIVYGSSEDIIAIIKQASTYFLLYLFTYLSTFLQIYFDI
ncbi:hypothetical protein SK128_019835 [Halocaridina rubra]|uniref:Uncharacterized protein n=1 Tax=Halocaridina rubra TaxID=373956 RepID=A0AAN8XH69_HALRR